MQYKSISKGQLMSTVFKCHACDHLSSGEYTSKCRNCGSYLVPIYQPIWPRENNDRRFGERFSDVLALTDVQHSCRETESLRTRTVESDVLARRYGISKLFLKDETSLPTQTTKARMAASALAYLYEKGVDRFVVTSTGNSTSAMARLMQFYPKMKMIAFAGRDFESRHQFPELPNIEIIITNGDFVHAEKEAFNYANKISAFIEGGFWNPARRVGLATAYLEAVWDIGRHPDWYFQAVSSGMGILAVSEIAPSIRFNSGITNPLPKLVPVQQRSCAPMVNAWNRGASRISTEDIVIDPKGIAMAILRGDPSASYPLMFEAVKKSSGTFFQVTEDEIKMAVIELYEDTGIIASASGATALAGAIAAAKKGLFKQGETVLVNVTGGRGS